MCLSFSDQYGTSGALIGLTRSHLTLLDLQPSQLYEGLFRRMPEIPPGLCPRAAALMSVFSNACRMFLEMYTVVRPPRYRSSPSSVVMKNFSMQSEYRFVRKVEPLAEYKEDGWHARVF